MSNYKPKINHPSALKYRKDIENRVREGLRNNLTKQAILDSISHMNEAPRSFTTLYKIYGNVIEEESYANQVEIGSALRRKIQAGDSKLIEFAARTKMGLNPTTQIKEVDEESENKDAISRLAQLLGKDTSDPKES